MGKGQQIADGFTSDFSTCFYRPFAKFQKWAAEYNQSFLQKTTRLCGAVHQ